MPARFVTFFIFLFHFLICVNSVSFQDEPGKQVRSAISIKNISRSHLAFKVWNLALSIVFFIFSFFGC